MAASVGADTAPASAEYDLECDVFSPCATGGVLNAATIPRLRCRIVAGAANNQLADDADAERLADAGILYAPDYVVNAGGVLHLAGYERLGWYARRMPRGSRRSATPSREVFEIADRDGVTPTAAAAAERARAGRRLATAQTVARVGFS